MNMFVTSDAEITRTTRYIADDAYVASIYGVTKQRVKYLRRNMEEERRVREDKSRQKGHICSSAHDMRYEERMRVASHKLREAVLALAAQREGLGG